MASHVSGRRESPLYDPKRLRAYATLLANAIYPTENFSGVRELLQLQLVSPSVLGDDLLEFRQQPQDVVAYLDLRAFPKGRIT